MNDPLYDVAPWLVILPLAWAGLAFVWGPGRGARLALTCTALQLLLALRLAAELLSQGSRHHAVGGWGAPLGIDLAVDGLSMTMLLLTQAVAFATFIYARAYFTDRDTAAGGHGHDARSHFWPLAGFLLAAMNALYLSADLFNLYVTLELLGLAAVGLVAAGGDATQVSAALRYLLVSLLASGAYLLGIALIYGSYGTVALSTLLPLMSADAPLAVTLAAALMGVALLLKTALFPFHFWLPPAHGGAPAPVSALLSALVVKATFYLFLRLGLDLFAPLGQTIAWLPGLLGSAAIFWGSWQALHAQRLKMLVAYSTVAQLGYLFLIFPLLAPDGLALQAGVMQALSHGLAKAAMFMAAGVFLQVTGRDAVADLAGVAGRLPVTLFAFGLAGITLMGLPPSGGFLAKWLLIDAALTQGQWGWAAVVIIGGLLTALYVFRVVRQTFASTEATPPLAPVPRTLEWTAFALAAASVLLGLRGMELLHLLDVRAAP